MRAWMIYRENEEGEPVEFYGSLGWGVKEAGRRFFAGVSAVNYAEKQGLGENWFVSAFDV